MLTALAILGLAGVAFGQEPPNSPAWSPAWTALPNSGPGVPRRYPRRAMEREQPGLVVLCCVPQDDGALFCRVGMEWPEGWGFGAAALKMSREYRMARQSIGQFRQSGLSAYKLTVPWMLEPMSSERRMALQSAQQRAQRPDLCEGAAIS